MNREPQTPSFDPASDGDRRPRRHRGRRPRRAMVIGGTVGLIAVVGGGYGVAQSLSGGGGETRAGAPAASEPTPDHSTEPLKDRSSVGEAAPSAPGTHSASPSASASKAPEKDRDQEKKDRAEARTEAGDKPDDQAPAKAGETTSTNRGNGSGNGNSNSNSSGSNRKPSAGGGAQAGGANGKYVQQVVDMVNAERAKAGCSPLTINAKLQAAAQGHSDDMAARDYYDHTSPEGKSPGDRMTAAGYHWSTYGENIFKSPKDARTAMDGWMKSSGHRANILNCSFKEIGVGINFKSNGPWWTQNFGASS
ncbi:CAP domain-containing protein [Streptomyces roseoverticillatus]|uniref:CAP domain-containing protein n=1 Tax=Streptomyces roseoverticillatus TaxID=66429 RepID=UPI001F1E3B3B|nr:CAP domain-containing protein [Streptomyces roseoverticillatus]